jgi:hypothetical protein
MNTRVLDLLRSVNPRSPFRRDPAFDDLGDSFWLGGEAQVAPAVLPGAPSKARIPDDDLDDPEWLVI